MVFIYLICLAISCFFIFIGKAIADIVSDEVHWNQSIFSDWGAEDSYWGHKDASWVRKDHDNFLMNYLLHTILVFVTDIWHTANTIRRIGIYASLAFGILLGFSLSKDFDMVNNLPLIIFGFMVLNIGGFHVFYHTLLRKGKAEE